MGIEVLTDGRIQSLLFSSKKVINSSTRDKTKGKHLERNYEVVCLGTNEYSFNLFVRQSILIENDFSCGLIWNMPSGEIITLIRYNGSSHSHPNHLEQEKLGFNCHIHKATERYIKAGKKAEGYAEVTDRYSTVEGALHCLVKDCNIAGVTTNPDQLKLIL